MRVKDYPFAEDGLLIWEALHKYFTAYVALYYADDAAVAADTWLQEW
jgi:lipoxygenase